MYKYTRVVIRFGGMLRRSGEEEFALIGKEIVSLVEEICTERHVHLVEVLLLSDTVQLGGPLSKVCFLLLDR